MMCEQIIVLATVALRDDGIRWAVTTSPAVHHLADR
jgi:hypothetical protein